MAFGRIAIFLVSVQIIIGNIQFEDPGRVISNYRSDEFYCRNNDTVLKNEPREPKMVYWVENMTYEIEFSFTKDRANENHTMGIYVVKWDQNLKNLTAILPPSVSSGFPQMVTVDSFFGEYDQDKSGMIKLPNNGKSKLNITLTQSHVCRPDSFQCQLVLDQNRTGNFPGEPWRSCTDVLIFTHRNDVRMTIVMQSDTPLLPSSIQNQLFNQYKDDGITHTYVKRTFPDPEGENKFAVDANNRHQMTLVISDQKGFNSEEVCETVKTTYEERLELDEIVSVRCGGSSNNNDQSKSRRMGLGIVFAIGLFMLSVV